MLALLARLVLMILIASGVPHSAGNGPEILAEGCDSAAHARSMSIGLLTAKTPSFIVTI